MTKKKHGDRNAYIRERLAAGESITDLARQYHLSGTRIAQIRDGKVGGRVKKRPQITARGRRKLSQSLKKRWALVKRIEREQHLTTTEEDTSDPRLEAVVAACFGYITHSIEEHARRAGFPAHVVAERVAAVFRDESRR